MARHPHLFDIDSLIEARVDFIQEARALPPGGQRNQKRQIARSLKRLIEGQSEARDFFVSSLSIEETVRI